MNRRSLLGLVRGNGSGGQPAFDGIPAVASGRLSMSRSERKMTWSMDRSAFVMDSFDLSRRRGWDGQRQALDHQFEPGRKMEIPLT
jgi:hypothetical protein